MKKSISILIIALGMCTLQNLHAQIKITDNLSVQGYVQAQAEISGKDGKTFTGDSYSKSRDNDHQEYLRYGVRRGRLRFIYSQGIGKVVYELNIRESGVSSMLAYLQVTPAEWISLQAGLINDFFGYEMMYPSNKIETMERSQLMRYMFPDLHEMGAKLTLKAPSSWGINGLKLDMGVISANAVNKVADGQLNTVYHLHYDGQLIGDDLTYGVGASYLNGRVNNANDTMYTYNGREMIGEKVAADKKNKREYFGVDFQAKAKWALGTTRLMSEYMWGTQPSRLNSFESQSKGLEYAVPDTTSGAFSHIRHFKGGYIYLLHEIASTPLELALKYGHYDYNTSGASYTTSDLTYDNYGFGIIWNISKNVRLLTFFDMYKNDDAILKQTGKKIGDLQDNLLTIRLQCKF